MTLSRDARLLREAFMRPRRDVRSPCLDEHARNLAKRVGCGRVQLAEHIVVLCWDGFSRGAPQPDVEFPFHEGLTMVRDWFAAQRRGERIEIPALIQRAIAAQGAATNAEVSYLATPSPKAVADVADALDSAIVELESVRDEISIERRAQRVA